MDILIAFGGVFLMIIAVSVAFLIAGILIASLVALVYPKVEHLLERWFDWFNSRFV